jgi:outer membrane protein
VKRSIISKLAVALMAVSGALALPAWAEMKIGVVDPQRLLEESPQGKAASESMRTEFAPRQRTLQAQEQALKAKQEKLQKDAATMTEDQRVRAEKELRDGMRDLERARGEFNDDATARRNEEMSRLQRTLGEEVRNYAKAQNYDLILTAETLVYFTPTFDITPAILAALQAHSTTPAAAKPAPTPPSTKPAPTPPSTKPQPK